MFSFRRVPNAWRIVNDGDVFTGVPKFWSLYKHCGHNAVIKMSRMLWVSWSTLVLFVCMLSERHMLCLKVLDKRGNLIMDPNVNEDIFFQKLKRKGAPHTMYSRLFVFYICRLFKSEYVT